MDRYLPVIVLNWMRHQCVMKIELGRFDILTEVKYHYYCNIRRVLVWGIWKRCISSQTSYANIQCVRLYSIPEHHRLTSQYLFRAIGKISMGTLSKRTVNMACFVDADHAGNKVTRRSHTGIMIFLQNAPILAFIK